MSAASLRARYLGDAVATSSPQQVLDRVKQFETAGVNLLLLQCSPQLEEMERFAEQVIRKSR